MSSNSSKIKSYIKAIAGKNSSGNGGGHPFIIGEVVSADGTGSCTVKVGDTVLTDVRTGAVIDENTNNLLITPAKGSKVLLADLSGGDLRDLAVISFSRIDSITINGGKLGGLVNVATLNQNLGSIKTYCETLKSAVLAGFGAVGTGMEASGSEGALAFEGAMKVEIGIQNMEDTKIKH